MYQLLVMVNPEHMLGYVCLLKGKWNKTQMLHDGFACIRQVRDRHDTPRTSSKTREAKKILMDTNPNLYKGESGEYDGWNYNYISYDDQAIANRCKTMAIEIGHRKGLYIINSR